MVLVKKLIILHFPLFGKIGPEHVFDDILERKQAFLDYKNMELNKSKTWDFSKGVSSWFCSKH